MRARAFRPSSILLAASACVLLAGCSTLGMKAGARTEVTKTASASQVPMSSDIRQILTQNGVDPGTAPAKPAVPPAQPRIAQPETLSAQAAALAKVSGQPAPVEDETTVGVLTNPQQISALPDTPAAALTPTVRSTPEAFGSGDQFGQSSFLPGVPTLPQNVVVITGPEAVPHKSRQAPAKKPAASSKKTLDCSVPNADPKVCPPAKSGPSWSASPQASATAPVNVLRRF